MFRFDKRIIYVVLIIIVLKLLSSYLGDTNSLLNLMLTLPGVLIAITFHEYAHAYAADKLGDDTARKQGRLNLNPLSHIDPIGIIMLIFAGFGWGKPVQVNPRNFNKDISMSKAEAIVSIAGPIANFIIAIILGIIYGLIIKFNLIQNMTYTAASVVLTIIINTIVINIGLGIFNLIPLPPLDGSKVLTHFLPSKAKIWFEQNQQIFYIVFLIIWVTGIAGQIITPAIGYTYVGLMKLISIIMGM